MSKIAFICQDGMEKLFAVLGVDAFVAGDKTDAVSLLTELAFKGYGIIYVLERFVMRSVEEIDDIRRRNNVSIVIVPDHASDLGLGEALTRLATIDAVGTDAIFSKGDI